MPGIPLVAGETACSRGADQMCRQNSCVHLSAEEKDAWDESLSIYCKPLELYNILSRRAIINPSFLPRCLQYKIQAKHKRRVQEETFSFSSTLLEVVFLIQMTVSLRATVHDGSQIRSLFPLCIMLARLVSNLPTNEQEAYRFKRSCLLTSCAGEEEINRTQAKFILPEIKKLSADIKSGSLSICFISNANAGGHCLVGKIPMELLHLSWQKSPKNLGERAEMLLTVDMNPCFMKKSFLDEDNCVSFQTTHSSARVSSQQLQVIITAEEIGANERSSYDSYTYNDIPSSALASITRLRSGNVIFNYKYYNNKLQTSEVTEDFTCTFCLVKCASFKGLRYHLLSSHDFFNFEFWATEEYQAVNVFAKTDTWRYEDIADGIDPQQQTFLFRSRCLRRKKRKSRIQSMRHVHPLALASDLPEPTDKLPDRTDEFVERDASSPNAAVVSSITTLTNVDAETVQSFPGSSSAASTILQLAKKRKLSERSDPNNRTLLQKRKFFHSHRAQPMSLEQVFSDMDSEDEVDDDVADLEDLRMLDDFVDVTKDEKQMMHLWNSFHRKQRVRADGHVLWACEAFSMLHGQVLVRRPPLLWCWRLFMINLWNYGLIDARCMNNCNIIFERMQRNGSSGQ